MIVVEDVSAKAAKNEVRYDLAENAPRLGRANPESPLPCSLTQVHCHRTQFFLRAVCMGQTDGIISIHTVQLERFCMAMATPEQRSIKLNYSMTVCNSLMESMPQMSQALLQSGQS